ncbi:Anhydrotetracycline monooxygenase [Frankia canadensis]|uniref:Anhydrotetracycline monooxygenase n=1 Tax=Frankia canadensis TaxID=1836972 RepID=A0A2I2KLD8_9ACTN|nr:FAD-dependent monooxygenase [Frankia canadensis]SNQ46488.1 Anhydrotetracycline monooxygenase [Frankia canadensis]SOU53778.1 Anhydrotetracycline monooxygenase [Frankia canadensis]
MTGPVLIAGAGPVGLMLAGELRLGGAEVVVIERRERPSGESRGLGFTARTAEVFAQRGLLDAFGPVETNRQGHFGGIPMDFGVLPGAYFGVRGVPQDRTERVLEDWARGLGAQILRGHELVDLAEQPDGVRVGLTAPGGHGEQRVELTGSYLVACDGGRSTVRALAGFDFPGTDATREMYLADVVGASIRPRFIGERVAGGMVMSAPLTDGVDRIIVCEQGTAHRPGRREPEFAEVADAWARLTGESLHGARASWVSAFTDATRLVTEYRRGRVLIAGDAAHVHLPAGGQGLSLGVQDAANLGWKLAAAVAGRAPAGLLDSYHSERRPVAERVLRNTRAQGLLYLSGAEIEPLRAVFGELMELPEVGRRLSGMVSGFDVRYDVGSDDHPLLGARMPDVAVGSTTVAAALRPARGVLLDPAGTTMPTGWADRVDVVTGTPGAGWPADTTAILLRPDGYVAWTRGTADGGPAHGERGRGLVEALRRWFGPPRGGAQHGPARRHAALAG